VKSKTGKAGPKFAQRSLILLVVALSVLVVSLAAHASAIPQAESVQGISIPIRGGPRVQESPAAVVTAFEVALNTHNVTVALSLFTDDAVVLDPSNIACWPGSLNIRCQPTPGSVGIGTTQIRGWLQVLAEENIQVKEIGALESTGNNVTWTWEVSVDEYRRLNVAPLVGTGEATVQGNLIKYLKFVLRAESEQKLQAAFATVRQSPYSVAAGGFAVGMLALGLVFPTAAVYYVSRVKKLFATVPRLDKPWMLLGAGVGALFISVLFVALRDVVGMSTSIVDPLFDVILVICAFLIMSAMILMKRVMISEPNE
jgi:hypothetical protein